MAEEPRKDVGDMTVAELRKRASELEITGRSSMSKAELHQAVVDAEPQVAGTESRPAAGDDWQTDEADGSDGAEQGKDEGEHELDLAAPSIGPHTHLERFQEPPEERLAKHEQSDVDAMGLDKRRAVVGQKYGASFAKQATIYGIFLAVMAALLIGGKLAADELDQGPEVNPDEAPWSQADAEQRPPAPIDFPRNPSP